MRGITIGLLLLFGLQLWLVVGKGMLGRERPLPWIFGMAIAAALVPQTRRGISWLLDRVAAPAPAARAAVAIVLWVGSAWFFVDSARREDLDLVPRIHDESSYLIQTRMILRGRLWMPQHPLADFLETFHVLTRPVYASKYFVGAALLYAPGLGIGLPYYWLPALAAGGAVAVSYLILTALTDGVGGMVGATLLLANYALRRAAVLYTAAAPLMLLALLGLWCYLRWRRSPTLARRAAWSAAIGFFIAWAGITRPLDAMCFAIAIGAAMAWESLRGGAGPSSPAARHSPRSLWISVACILLGGLPPLAVQLIANVGITGHLTRTAWGIYARQDDPYDGLALGPIAPDLKPRSTLPQKQEFSEGFTKPAALGRRAPGRLRRWLRDDLRGDADVALPHPLLLVLIPIGLLAIVDHARRGRTIGRIVLYATLPLATIAYAFYAFGSSLYLVIGAPAAALGVVLGIEAAARGWPRRGDVVRALLVPLVLALALTQMPQFNRLELDDLFRPAEPRQYQDALAALPHKPAIVLFHYTPGADNPHVEPVYNTDVAWPDDAPVIRAQDLGPRKDRALFDYYAQRQPSRFVYLYDRATSTIHPLGNVQDLAAHPPTTLPVTATTTTTTQPSP